MWAYGFLRNPSGHIPRKGYPAFSHKHVWKAPPCPDYTYDVQFPQNCIRFFRRQQEDQDTVPSSSHESGRRTGTCTGKERHRHNFRICQVCGDIACDAAILQLMCPRPFSSTGAPYFYADQAGTRSGSC
ncbi:Uncharacterised protein [Phocaeicola vulgatus]|uniref:Uncharacterized protein n=1 Tax=Phocaeicola vulgatus TaxID=821 RepID=A0A174P3K4_PHOVU|nr:Uncharacterised protein [Phocaeicola vulgatus]